MDAAVKAALQQGHIGRIIYAIQLDFDSGTLYYTTNPNGVTFDSQSYTYLGALGSISTVKETEALDPADYELVIGGADPSVLSLILSENIINRSCQVIQLLQDNEGVLVGEMSRFQGIMQPAKINHGKSTLITIPIKDALADWNRNIDVLYTNEEQLRIDPTDKCLEHVSEISGRVIIWPASSFYD